jgi:hypothetical protein
MIEMIFSIAKTFQLKTIAEYTEKNVITIRKLNSCANSCYVDIIYNIYIWFVINFTLSTFFYCCTYSLNFIYILFDPITYEDPKASLIIDIFLIQWMSIEIIIATTIALIIMVLYMYFIKR